MSADSSTHGFTWEDGVITRLDPPGSVYTQLNGINDDGTIVGMYQDASNNIYGFSLSKDGAYTVINYPDAYKNDTIPYAINNEGVIAGSYNDGNKWHGFSLGGTYGAINYPTVTSGVTFVYGINDEGSVVGYYRNLGADAYQAFSLIDGAYATIDYSEWGPQNEAYGINNEGTIVGYYTTKSSSLPKGFIQSNGAYTTFIHPDSPYHDTALTGINTVGMLVGWYDGVDSKGNSVRLGFLATPELTVCKLTVSKKAINKGAGTVTSEDGNINCGATCSHKFYCGARVNLTATPSAGSTFTGWSGGGCSGTDACTITMAKATTVKATFTGPAKLTVTKAAFKGGAGTVTSEDGDIDCGPKCKASYQIGSEVTLTATPSSGSTFRGWSGGGCTGTGTCAITMAKATTVKATFTGPAKLTVTKTAFKGGAGTVTSEDGDIDCGPKCKASYQIGSEVTLTATPSSGSTFRGWSGGGCTGTGTCALTINKATTVKATFRKRS